MANKQAQIRSIAEYLLLEEQADERNEYHHGLIVAMGGGTLNHGIIGNNINTALSNAIRTKELACIPINGDVRVFIERANSFVYPDGMVICGEIETYEQDEHSVINPVLIVEVLSKSTGSYDRGDKFHKYCSLPSFKEYVLIDQYKPVVDVLFREDNNYWKMRTTIGLDKEIELNALGITIPMSIIYRNAQDLSDPQIQLDL